MITTQPPEDGQPTATLESCLLLSKEDPRNDNRFTSNLLVTFAPTNVSDEPNPVKITISTPIGERSIDSSVDSAKFHLNERLAIILAQLKAEL